MIRYTPSDADVAVRALEEIREYAMCPSGEHCDWQKCPSRIAAKALATIRAGAGTACSKCGGKGWYGADGAATPCNSVTCSAAARPGEATGEAPSLPDAVVELFESIEDKGGAIKEIGGPLSDGSGYAIASLPLPKDHWLTRPGLNVPPMSMRTGNGPERRRLADQVKAATRYAVRASTMNGEEMDFDPDAMVQNMVVGLLGYWTDDGLSSDEWANPPQHPPGDGACEMSTKLRPRKSTAARAREFVDAMLANELDRDGLEALAELFFNREAGRAYDALLRQVEQATSRGAKCPLCGNKRARPGTEAGK